MTANASNQPATPIQQPCCQSQTTFRDGAPTSLATAQQKATTHTTSNGACRYYKPSPMTAHDHDPQIKPPQPTPTKQQPPNNRRGGISWTTSRANTTSAQANQHGHRHLLVILRRCAEASLSAALLSEASQPTRIPSVKSTCLHTVRRIIDFTYKNRCWLSGDVLNPCFIPTSRIA